ncbi:adenylate isopentenyltransferase 4 [Venturia nashicola]|nr:adenylate isopentenyltransferase 4 [Venturia nashicola]
MRTHSLIAIIGPTGIGKTKLGVAYAKFLDGEVISVDSLQVYRDGGIMTAKPTLDEMDGIEHYLIDYLDAEEEPTDFDECAVEKIKLIQKRGKIPILVGGSTSLMIPLLSHPFVRGQDLNVVIMESDMEDLGWKLDARVDQMVGQGLLEEARHLYTLECELRESERVARGIWKSIGYPELRSCFEVDEDSPLYHSLLAAGLARMKANTRSYAATQLAWIRKDLIPGLRERGVEFTVFNAGISPWTNANLDLIGGK